MASRRRASDSKAGAMSAYFFTRWRSVAMSPITAAPQARIKPASAALVPVDAVGLDDVVERPALLVEAAHDRRSFRMALGSGETDRRERAARARAGGDELGGTQELTTIHAKHLPMMQPRRF